MFEEKLAIRFFFGEYMKKKESAEKNGKEISIVNFFKMLMKSVNEAVAIHKGEIEPARITTLKM
ncbi:hypothetical protein CKQ87_28380 [Klebsiella pneumoniae]|nr:hypothetical protein CKQ87_28380 [Klebsiella pneumoniae]